MWRCTCCCQQDSIHYSNDNTQRSWPACLVCRRRRWPANVLAQVHARGNRPTETGARRARPLAACMGSILNANDFCFYFGEAPVVGSSIIEKRTTTTWIGMTIQIWVSGTCRVSDPMEPDTWLIFYRWVAPVQTRTKIGTERIFFLPDGYLILYYRYDSRLWTRENVFILWY
jgi:hypothetical protein